MNPVNEKPRTVHVGYLVSGLLLLLVALVWAIGQRLAVDGEGAALLAASALVVAGGLGLLAWGLTHLRD
ncbi:MAG: hypothetical protein Q8Q02_04795 [Nocardioides sp.]|nr:hypothetical protein [Nocardioides sp.]